MTDAWREAVRRKRRAGPESQFTAVLCWALNWGERSGFTLSCKEPLMTWVVSGWHDEISGDKLARVYRTNRFKEVDFGHWRIKTVGNLERILYFLQIFKKKYFYSIFDFFGLVWIFKFCLNWFWVSSFKWDIVVCYIANCILESILPNFKPHS